MTNVLLIRTKKTPEATYGILAVIDKGLPMVTFKTIENTSKIFPTGVYPLIFEYSPRFKTDLWELYGIEGRREIKIHAANYTVAIRGKEIRLPKKEFEVLLFLAQHPDRVISRRMLLDEIWGHGVYVVDRTVDVHIRRLRKILSATGHDRLIQTVRGSGYRLSTEN